MKIWRIIFLSLITLFFSLNNQAQNISNEGTDFWSVFPTHDPSFYQESPKLANIIIYVSSKNDSEVTVTCGTHSQTKRIIANVVEPFTIQRADAYIALADINNIKVQKGIHIQVTPGMPKVAVYSHIYAGARSAASLVLPKEALGQQYYSMNYTQNGNINDGAGRNYLAIIATEPNTKIIIHTREGDRAVNFTNPGEVYEYMPHDQRDLTGTIVEIDPSSPDNCNKRFAVFSGNTSVSIGCGNPAEDSRDPLYQQLYPPTSWGKSYAVVPFKDRKYLLRILAQENDTQISFNGSIFTLNKGQFYDSPSALIQPLFIKANRRISVAQYSLSQICSSATNSEMIGDPEMVLLNPIEFNIKAITLFSSTKESISQRYINVSMKTSATSTFKINGAPPENGTWSLIPSNPEYSGIQIRIDNVSSTLTANDGFNAIAYGFGAYESYSYSAGTNLSANNYLLIRNKITNAESQSACIGQKSNFKIVLPYKALKITWNLEGYSPVNYTPEPEIIATADGPSYVYVYDRDFIFNELGEIKMLITAVKPNEDNCLGGEIEYDFDFDVNPIPTALISLEADACEGSPIVFTDKSSSNIRDKPINKWLWDFGDDHVSTEQNPTHTYQTPGDFIIKFSAGRDDGCMSDVITENIQIKATINAQFSAPLQACINTGVAFRDESSGSLPPGIRIVKWYWDFGDGENSEEINPTHEYSNAGVYEASLVVEPENGCKSIAFKKSIKINGLPKPDFSVPEVCVEDLVKFGNISVNDDGTIDNLTYSWDFNDPAGNNISIDKDGKHKFSAPGIYAVKLTVTNTNGCFFSKTKNVTINSSVAKSSFEVLNKDNLCSDSKVIVKNTSTTPIGEITKLEWYKDNELVPFITDDDPDIGKTYEITYPSFSSAADKLLTITLKAYTGITCYDVENQSITLHATPSLVFDPVPNICIGMGKINIVQARETLGVGGTFKYTGPAGTISEDGVFDSQAAGTGTHQITYTFATSNGCVASISRSVTVIPIPVLKMERDIFIFEGGEKQPDVLAEGPDLTYKWSPSVNLSKDDIPNPIIKADHDREYMLTITSSQGCSTSQKVFVHVLMDIRPPNAFSPNGDGINDTWIINSIETYPNVTVGIFNRYGERVFFSEGYNVPFDGKFKDQALPVGTYYYIIDPNNGRKRVTGALTLLK